MAWEEGRATMSVSTQARRDMLLGRGSAKHTTHGCGAAGAAGATGAAPGATAPGLLQPPSAGQRWPAARPGPPEFQPPYVVAFQPVLVIVVEVILHHTVVSIARAAWGRRRAHVGGRHAVFADLRRGKGTGKCAALEFKSMR
jgi:hypothetical protein